MMTKSLRTLWLLMAVSLLASLSACHSDEPGSDGDPMEWSLPRELDDDGGTLVLPAGGGTFMLRCLNHKVRVASATDGDHLYAPNRNDRMLSLNGLWFTVKCSDGDVRLVVDPLPAGDLPRPLALTLCDGDIYDTLNFIQKP